MRSVLLLLMVFLTPFFVKAQTTTPKQTEFEGEIRYLHYFKYKKFIKDTGILIRQFGNSSYYYYKAGSYLWTFNGSDLQKEYSFNSSKKVYTKYKRTDTLFENRITSLDTILQYTIRKNADTILGVPVNELTVITAKKANKSNQITRRIYYSSKYPMLPQHASHLYNLADNEVFKITKAIPLRIEIESDAWPFSVRYQAVRIIPRKIAPTEFQLPKGPRGKL